MPQFEHPFLFYILSLRDAHILVTWNYYYLFPTLTSSFFPDSNFGFVKLNLPKIQHLKKLLPSFPNWHPFLVFSLLEIKMCIYSFLFTLSLLAKNYSVQFIPALQWLTINTITILYRYSSSFQNWVYPPWVIFTPYHLPNQELWVRSGPYLDQVFFCLSFSSFFKIWSTVYMSSFFHTLQYDLLNSGFSLLFL